MESEFLWFGVNTYCVYLSPGEQHDILVFANDISMYIYCLYVNSKKNVPK